MKSVMSFEMRRLVGPALGACALVGVACSPEAPLGRAGKAGAGGSGVEAGVPDASTGGAGGSGGDVPDVIIVPRDVGMPPPPCEGSICDAGPNMPAVCGDGKINRADEK